jgi:aminopeptidase N
MLGGYVPLALLWGLLLPGLLQAQQVDVFSRPVHYERNHDYDVLHYQIRLTFNLKSQSFWGDTTITLRPLRDDFSVCVLDAETFTVSKVEMEASKPLRFEQTRTTLIVYLPHPYGYGQQLSFKVYYREDNPQVDPQEYGMPKGYDLGLTFKAATADHPRLANTLSFPEGAHHWFPCYDHPDNRATSDIIATVDQPDEVISNGRLVSVTEDPKAKQKTFHWAEEKPIATYLYVLVVGPYVKVEDHLGKLPVDYWVYSQDVPDARRSFHNTPEMIRFFSDEFGYPYPWVKYDQIILPHFSGGAESTTATVLGDATIHDAKADPDFPSDWLVAHELAHQWWGDLVTMRDWSQAWLNEGFATYFQYVYMRHTLGNDEGAVDLDNKINQYLREAHERYERPIVFARWSYPNDNFDRHIYQKGAAVLDMLDWIMGDKDFLRALSYFLHQHAYQSVDTHDLEKAITDSTGQVYDWFFDEWVYKAGHPVFEVSYEWNESAKKVDLEAVQTQKTSAWVPIFEAPVVIAITTTSGKQSYKVWIRERQEHFEFPCAEKPLLVRFDEGNHLLKEMTFPKTVDELAFQLQHDDVIGRMWAASQLSRHLDDSPATTALRQSAAGDPFWAVREKALVALAPSLGIADVAFLKERALDPKSAVRAAALRALGNLHDHSLVSFFQDRYNRDNSYVAEAEALRSIGKSGDSSAIQFLQSAGRVRSPGQIIHSAAEDAIQMIEKQQ